MKIQPPNHKGYDLKRWEGRKEGLRPGPEQTPEESRSIMKVGKHLTQLGTERIMVVSTGGSRTGVSLGPNSSL